MKYLEDELFSYPGMEKHIRSIREEIINPWKEQDTNIGGGRSNSNVSTVEIKATRLVNDKRLRRMQEVKQAIETIYNEADHNQRKMLDVYYFTRPRTLTIDGVAQKMNVSRRTIFRVRKSILSRLADELGIIN
ncbi:transcriptional regulator [Salinicoccus roseus]|nr:transcriptional regulator [Salinicoccus roseus]